MLAGSHYLLHPHSLTIFEDTLYWTDRQLNRVLSAHKFKGNNQTVVSHLISQPLSIHVHHPSLQPVTENPCVQAPCDHLCLSSPSTATGYQCKCRAGFKLTSENRCVEDDTPFILLMKGSQIVDTSLNPGETVAGTITPIVGIENGKQIEYDKKSNSIFWLECRGDEDNNVSISFISRLQLSEIFLQCTLWTTPLGGGNKTRLLGADSGIVGAPSSIAFDWLGRNLFIANRLASNFEVVRVDGKNRYRSIILANEGQKTSVADPRGICLDPTEGKLYWTDAGGHGVPQKIGKVSNVMQFVLLIKLGGNFLQLIVPLLLLVTTYYYFNYQVNMDGSDPVILVEDDIERPEAITIDIESKTIYFSTLYPPRIQSIDTTGARRTTILTEANDIAMPKAISVMGSRLYYLDPTYEKLVQVALPSGSNPRVLLENEPDLKTFTIFKKRFSVSCL